MDYFTILAQILGISGMIMIIFSMQCRSNANFFICQALGGLFFSISFFMLGGWSGALMNIFGIIRPEILRREKIAASGLTLYGLMLLLIISALVVIFFFDEKWYLILLVAIAQAAGTYFMWTQNGKNIRLCQLCIVSPLWLIYNIMLPIPSIGGILTETINILSVLTALFRYRKIGFTRH